MLLDSVPAAGPVLLYRWQMRTKYYRYKDSHRTVKGVKQKRCTMCEKWKPESDFHKDLARTDGLKIRCKKCDTEYQRKLRRKKEKKFRKYLKLEERHRTFRGAEQKLCTHCKKWKNENEFYRNRQARDGLHSCCKVCQNKGTASNQDRRVLRRNLQYDESHRVVSGVKQKLCSHCRKWKGENSFYKKRGSRYGLGAECKECSKTRARERYRPKGKRLGRYFRFEERHRTVDGVREKFCRKCGKWKKESDFYNSRSAKDGLDSQCKKCTYKPVSKFREK